MLRPMLAPLAFLLLVPASPAQTCNAGEFFFKNDVLPANPGGAAVSVIQGLCEGEACGCVFDVSAVSTQVKIQSAAVGFIQVGGTNGTQALVKLKIYDGVTFPGGIPQLGPEVFDFVNVTGSSIVVTSSAINTVDLSGYNIVTTSGKLVLTWWMDFNPSGSCASGYPANFATDYPTGGANCNVHQKNLIYILGQGWRDASTAQVQGVTLCPVYYAGNWLIRSCVASAGAIQPYCFGDGSLVTACPCGNNGSGGHGCENSAATGGALMTSTGTASPDTVVLTSSGELPSVLGIFLQGTTTSGAGIVFGDGVRCATGTLKRLYVKAASGGVAVAPGPGDPSITARSAALGDPIAPGSTRYYQRYYRDPNPVFCPNPPGNSWNVSNGIQITW